MCNYISLTYCELESMKNIVLETMNLFCLIENKGAVTKDTQGRNTYAIGDEVYTVCRLMGLTSPKESISNNKIVSSSQHKIILPIDTDINEKDKIIINDVNYEVQATDKGRSNATYITCYCIKSN
mgnify:CR=1 FL=1